MLAQGAAVIGPNFFEEPAEVSPPLPGRTPGDELRVQTCAAATGAYLR